MTTPLDYAILAGASYFSTRSGINRFPIPLGWLELIDDRRANSQSGFEARAFQSGSELVISYAGTYAKSGADIQAGINLGLGLGSAQLHQGRRTIMEYLLSPVQKVSSEAGRER